MGLQTLPSAQAYPAYPPQQVQRSVQPQAPQQPTTAAARPPQQASFNTAQVTPQDVAFFQEVLKMNPETAQIAGALPPQQIAQILGGDKEILGTVRQLEGMLPPGTPASALASLMPPMPPAGQPNAMPPQRQQLSPPAQPPQPGYGYPPVPPQR